MYNTVLSTEMSTELLAFCLEAFNPLLRLTDVKIINQNFFYYLHILATVTIKFDIGNRWVKHRLRT